jgi:hypothetical protein
MYYSPFSAQSRKRLRAVLIVVFAIAIVMGAGPGLYLVNPDPSDPGTNVTWLGVPIVYAWVILWFLVQACVVVVAYLFLWTGESRQRVGSR